MKRFLLPVATLLTAAVIFSSCNSNSPKIVAQKWLTSFYHMDYETAKKYSTEDTKKLLATFEQFSVLTNDTAKQHMKKIQVTIKDVKEKGDTAMVKYVITDVPKEQSLKLVKQQGKWLVAKSKQDDMNEDNSGTDQAPPTADSTSAPMPVDSSAAPK